MSFGSDHLLEKEAIQVRSHFASVASEEKKLEEHFFNAESRWQGLKKEGY